jgi:thymidylate synthase
MNTEQVMLPYMQREPDTQYRNCLRAILEKGERTKSQQGVDAIVLTAPPPMRFRFANGFPMITERNMAPQVSEHLPVSVWQQAIGEICAFINGARTLDALESFGCFWWKDWGTPEKCRKRGLEPGDLGPGSYGAAFHDFPTVDGGTFNQFQHLVEQIREMPHLRTHIVTPFIPQYLGRGTGKQQKVVVVPCHGMIHARVVNNKLTLHMWQRSGDVPIGVPSNMVQYAALTMMLARVTGTIPYEYVHSISDAHIYVDQIPYVEKMLEREPRRFPTIHLAEKAPSTDIFAFRKEHFTLSDYEPHPGIKGIPVAI